MKKRLYFSNLACVGIVIVIMLSLLVSLYIVKKPQNETSAETLKKTKEDSIYNVLFLGKDDAAGLCDVIILASVNTDNGNINLMQIPRDTYFNCSNSNYKKINAAYNFLGSASSVSTELSKALGVKIDYYVSLNLDTVAKIVDALNGIEVNVPEDMDYNDPEQNLSIHLKAGNQTLYGKESIEFLRYRAGYVTGDLGRIDAQKLFLNAFANRVEQIGNPLALCNVFKIICENSETNIKLNDFLSIAFKCVQAKNGQVLYMTAPGEAIQSQNSGAWYYILSAPSVSELLKTHFERKETFDKENKFVDKNTQLFYEIYNKNCEVKIYTSDDIENNKININ